MKQSITTVPINCSQSKFLLLFSNYQAISIDVTALHVEQLPLCSLWD